MRFKITVSLLLLLCVYSTTYAQNEGVRKVEFEIGGGVVYPNLYDGIPGSIGFQLHGEARFNPMSTFDLGIRYAFSKFDRDDLLSKEYHNFESSTISAFLDYNWRPAKNLNVFAGLGMGCAFIEDNKYYINQPDGIDERINHTLFVITPRLGVELFNRVRFTLEYKLSKIEYSYLGMSIGVVFGGGNK